MTVREPWFAALYSLSTTQVLVLVIALCVAMLPVTFPLCAYWMNRLLARVERDRKRGEATLDILSDSALMQDLRKADAQPDEEARAHGAANSQARPE